MSPRLTFALALAGALSTLGCGPDAELVASGKAHECAMQAARAQLEANPNDTAAQEALRERSELLQAVIGTAGEGERADLEAAIHAAAAEGCP